MPTYLWSIRLTGGGADYLVTALEQMLHMSPGDSEWEPPIVTTQALHNIGIEELYHQIERHRKMLQETGQLSLRRQGQRRGEFVHSIEEGIMTRLLQLVEKDGQLMAALEKVERGELDPHSASLEILTNKTLLQTWLAELEKES